MIPVLETERLALREMTAGDVDFVAELLGHAEVMRYFPKCYSRDEVERWVQRQIGHYASHGYGYWLALDRATKQPVGQVGVLPFELDGVEEVALGYLIHRPFWRRGLATEAAAACRDYAFEVLDQPWLITLIRPENLPSLSVAWKLGLKPQRQVMYGGFLHMMLSMPRDDG